VDWKAVAGHATTILAEKSKDLLVAAYLARALFAIEGYAGLATGLTVVRDLMAAFWEPLFPPRPRARAAAAAWLGEKLGAAVAARPPGAGEAEAVEQAAARAEEVEAALGERLGDDAPGLGELRRALRENLARSAAPKAAPKPAQAAPAAASSGGGPDLSAPIESDADLRKVLKAWQDGARAMAAYLRGRDPADPRPYLMLRWAAWMGIEALPPAQDGQTQLRGVTDDQAQAFKLLLEKGDRAALIEQVEASVPRMPFWLDAHRLTCAALQDLGHMEARDAVIASTGAFLKRFPGVLELAFAGGRPFADEDTRRWIETEVQSADAAAPAGGEGGEEPPWVAIAREAKALASKKGGVEKGLVLFEQGVRGAFSLRERFQWELARARFCRDAGHAPLAIAQLEALDDQVARFDLEAWEPQLAVEVAKLLLLCYKGLPKARETGPDRAVRVERLRARLCRFDVTAALALDAK